MDTHNEKPEHYGPLAINSILGKVFEKLINYRIYHFLYINNCFPTNQFGFSATDALEETSNIISNNTINKSILISLDIKNVFNHIQLKHIKEYLDKVKCRSNIGNLVPSMLLHQAISYTATHINIEMNLRQGSSKGSPLSPPFWNIIISPPYSRT